MASFKHLSTALLCALLGGVGCSGPGDRPNVLLVVIDGCRPDKLGSYGFERPAAPALDAVAADPDSVVFERHYVQADWTKPSTASLFTGLYLYQHRVALGPEPAGTPYWSAVLPAEHVTMAEAFRDAGYFTFGVVRIAHLHPDYGFGQGFAEYRYFGSDEVARDETLRFVGQSDRPFFGYLHLLGCHGPYPAQDRDRAYMEAFGFDYDEAARAEAGIDFSEPSAWRVADDLGWTDEDARFLHLVHEARLRKLDRTILDPLFETLRRSGAYDDTLLVVTADHGWELLEHGGYTHGHALWEEIIHVPLVVKFPAGRRPPELDSRWAAPTGQIDLYPTLVGVAGGRIEADLPGIDLFAGQPSELILSERAASDIAVDTATIRGDEKVIHRVEGAPSVFDLAGDPGERNDLAASAEEAIAASDRAIKKLRWTYPMPDIKIDPSSPELTEEQIEALRSLGYIQ